MKSILKLICLIGVAVISLPVMTAAAAPLPAGTKLGITQGVGSGPNLPCATGSCFSMDVAPGFSVWTDFGPGTDGGFIVGKAQKCGTQELGPSSADISPSELSNAWNFFGNYGTFCTDPGGEQNIFDNASCTGAACIGKTELKYLYVVWNANKIPLGSSTGCVHPNCTPNQTAGIFVNTYQINPVTGGAWNIDFKQVVPSGQFLGVRFGMTARGVVTLNNIIVCPGCTALPTNIVAVSGQVAIWTPAITNPSNAPITCRIGTPPGGGAATIASNCSAGTYKSNPGYVGTDTFTYIFNDGNTDIVVVVTVVVVELSPTPPPPLPTATPSEPPSPTVIVQDISLTVNPGNTVSWYPRYQVLNDIGFVVSNCSVTSPSQGTATVASNCSIGSYTASNNYTGIDSFNYVVAGCVPGAPPAQYCASGAGTVTVNVVGPGVTPSPTPIVKSCSEQYPVIQSSQLGKQGTLSIRFTGNIVSSTNNEIKICPGTSLSYTASSTKDSVKCKVKNSLTSGNGTLRIRDHLKCTDKPLGKDKVQFKVKSGISK